ncbi:MAG: hypothetical protein K0R25_779 [Rickettsiaceae bacterium]|jgi:hypothetical protein|nr:hypothetical protein [Rickettsiaceae bacterium]
MSKTKFLLGAAAAAANVVGSGKIAPQNEAQAVAENLYQEPNQASPYHAAVEELKGQHGAELEGITTSQYSEWLQDSQDIRFERESGLSASETAHWAIQNEVNGRRGLIQTDPVIDSSNHLSYRFFNKVPSNQPTQSSNIYLEITDLNTQQSIQLPVPNAFLKNEQTIIDYKIVGPGLVAVLYASGGTGGATVNKVVQFLRVNEDKSAIALPIMNGNIMSNPFMLTEVEGIDDKAVDNDNSPIMSVVGGILRVKIADRIVTFTDRGGIYYVGSEQTLSPTLVPVQSPTPTPTSVLAPSPVVAQEQPSSVPSQTPSQAPSEAPSQAPSSQAPSQAPISDAITFIINNSTECTVARAANGSNVTINGQTFHIGDEEIRFSDAETARDFMAAVNRAIASNDKVLRCDIGDENNEFRLGGGKFEFGNGVISSDKSMTRTTPVPTSAPTSMQTPAQTPAPVIAPGSEGTSKSGGVSIETIIGAGIAVVTTGLLIIAAFVAHRKCTQQREGKEGAGEQKVDQALPAQQGQVALKVAPTPTNSVRNAEAAQLEGQGQTTTNTKGGVGIL